jgi:hypothetical protein
MNRFLIFLLTAMVFPRVVRAQEVVVDPAVSAAIAVDAATINGQLGTTNNRLSLIGQAQLAASSQLSLINELQHKVYQGLSQVASVVGNLSGVKDISVSAEDIFTDLGKAIALARKDPALLLLAQQGATDFQARALVLAAEVSGYILKGGPGNLMDSGERGRLLNHIAQQMRILRGIAYGMQRAMYWASERGIFSSLNPWASWQNMDARIARDVLSNAKYLKP